MNSLTSPSIAMQVFIFSSKLNNLLSIATGIGRSCIILINPNCSYQEKCKLQEKKNSYWGGSYPVVGQVLGMFTQGERSGGLKGIFWI